MKLSVPKCKLIRFDANLSKVDNINNIPFNIDPNAAVGRNSSKYPYGIVCRYRVFSLNKNNDEVFGYLREHVCAIIEFGNKEEDLIEIRNFCLNTFINVEIDFDTKMPFIHNIFSNTRPDFEILAKNVLKQLIEFGCYL